MMKRLNKKIGTPDRLQATDDGDELRVPEED
jgi:hypothetical protein